MDKLTLTQIESGVYTGKVSGKNSVVAFRQRNRAKAKDADVSITFSRDQITRAKAAARKEDLPVWVVTQVRVASKWHASYAIPIDKWDSFSTSHPNTDRVDFLVNEMARAKYTELPQGFHVEVIEAEKPEPKPKAEKKAAKKKHSGGSGGAAPAEVIAETPKEGFKLNAELEHITTASEEQLKAEGYKITGWTEAEEKEIARLQENEGLSRKSAVQKMRRAQIKQAAEARA